MKYAYLIIVLLLSGTVVCQAQSAVERGFNYQAVVRDNDGNMIPNAGVNFRFTFRITTWYGTLQENYKETQVATTNSLGIVNLVIGNGTAVFPFLPWDFENSIPWEDPSLNLIVEVDPSGSGTTYSLMSASPLRAVPFSYFAKKANEANYAQSAGQAQFANESYYSYSLYSPYTESVSFTNPSNTFTGSFTGNGSGLTNLSAGQIDNGILGGSFGGTGLNVSTVTPGTMLVSSASGTWNVIPPGSEGQVLKMSGGVPTWSAESSSGKLVSKQFTNGIPNNPSSTAGFITPVCTVTVTSSQQTVFVISTITLYGYSSTHPYVDGASLSLIVKPAGSGFDQILSTISATFSNDLDKRQYHFHGYPFSLAPGTYYIGIWGYRAAGAVGTVYGDWFKQDVLVFD